jgi:hypothetical protein
MYATCPMMTVNMVQVQKKLKADGLFDKDVAFVSITFDPVKDTPQVMKCGGHGPRPERLDDAAGDGSGDAEGGGGLRRICGKAAGWQLRPLDDLPLPRRRRQQGPQELQDGAGVADG